MHHSRPSRRPSFGVSPKVSDEDLDFLYERPVVYNLIVYDEEDIDTGILDPDGNSIVITEKIPMGFLADLFEP